jgi:hypothetical protein
MWRLLLLVYFFVAGAVAAFIGGFAAAVLLTLFTAGPLALLTLGPFIGGVGALVGFQLALLPAILFGALLWSLEIEEKIVWGFTGAIAALILQTFLGGMVVAPGWLIVTAAFMLAGIAAALTFRAIMMTLTGFSEQPGQY